jgi:ABC-type lipoprotein export system ATPase subunit
MERVGVSHRENHKPSELSGGEQQRVAIARALINKPQLLLADEPTGNLDTANTESVLELLQSVRREYNVTCIVATHSQQVASLADRILVMKDGKIVE